MIAGNIYCGDAATVLKRFPDECIDCVVTSPPYYGLRDYQHDGQIGGEETFEEYLKKLLEITAELKRVLTPKGTLWWNHGDSYAGSGKGYGDKNPDPKFRVGGKDRTLKPRKMPFPNKCLTMQPYRLAQRMIDEQGWILRNQIIWHKPNAMPASVRDRFTVDFEPILFFTKSKKYYFEQQLEPIKSINDKRCDDGRKEYNEKFKGDGKTQRAFVTVNSNGRNKRTVWKIPTKPYPGAHFAVYPNDIVETPIKAGCPEFICKKCGKARETIYKKSGQFQRRWSKNNAEGSPYGKQDSMQNTYNTELSNCGCKAGWKSGIVLDPFIGSGTTAVVAKQLGRQWIGIELNPEYKKLAEKRLKKK